MRFIIDAQLPPVLVKPFILAGHRAEHVLELGLNNASDAVIWNSAKEKAAVIVTKDEDFSIRLALDPAVPVVWIRIGNCTNQALLQKIKPLLSNVLDRLRQGEKLIEII